MKFNTPQEMNAFLNYPTSFDKFVDSHSAKKMTSAMMIAPHRSIFFLDEGWYVNRHGGAWYIIHIDSDGSAYWLEGIGDSEPEIHSLNYDYGVDITKWNQGQGWNAGIGAESYTFEPIKVSLFINWRTNPFEVKS